MLELLRDFAQKIPEPIIKPFGRLPISAKLYPKYGRWRQSIDDFYTMDEAGKNKFVLKKLQWIVSHAYHNIPFYKQLYGREPVIKNLSDFKCLPFISRDQIIDLKKSCDEKVGYIHNTGGTSGKPIQFILDKGCWAREWAHMISHWEMYGYSKSNQLVTMMGKNLGGKIYHKYNPVHNEYLFDSYKFDDISGSKLVEILTAIGKPICLQGYPTNIYRFLTKLKNTINGEVFIKDNILAIFCSSEGPSEHIKEFFLDVLNSEKICIWYGLSEQCIFAAGDISTNVYIPSHTYGYTEIFSGELIGTSFNNSVMPLIRYKTGDEVLSHSIENGMVTKFELIGRKSDFVIDSKGQRIPLVSFTGRHHSIYDMVEYIQVFQDQPGKLHYFVVPKDVYSSSTFIPKECFDFDSGLKMDFEIHKIEKPIQTTLGKTPPLIKSLPDRYRPYTQGFQDQDSLID